jgi:hypothetical protein
VAEARMAVAGAWRMMLCTTTLTAGSRLMPMFGSSKYRIRFSAFQNDLHKIRQDWTRSDKIRQDQTINAIGQVQGSRWMPTFGEHEYIIRFFALQNDLDKIRPSVR